MTVCLHFENALMPDTHGNIPKPRTGNKLNVDHRKKLKLLAVSAVFATNGLISPKPILRTIVIEAKW